MKLKPIHIALIVGFLFFESNVLFGQESPVYPPDNMESEKVQQYSNSDLKNLSSTQNSSLLDSAYVSRQNESLKEAEKNSAKQSEEDVISFNFLYYIIQKFKMSDIVDK
jgi:hypothetical protein